MFSDWSAKQGPSISLSRAIFWLIIPKLKPMFIYMFVLFLALRLIDPENPVCGLKMRPLLPQLEMKLFNNKIFNKDS